MKNPLLWIAVVFVLLGAGMRLVPHAPNFAPIAAIAIFGAAYLPKKLGYILPLCAMFLSDIIIGFYSVPIMVSVYLSFVVAGFLGTRLRGNANAVNTVGVSVASSLLFFLVTNAAVWVWGGMYPLTGAGLILSYIMGLQFLKYTLLGDLFYISVFFGGYYMVLRICGFGVDKTRVLG